ncbi:PDZ/DHR/GLGF domain protein [Oesophagostomum dentatum]|uniref:PDZ/DHR/GLGF domain protein n=1 Tax=Oesophagostomum dentatum TaxID=61180 RepID=A0A0B1TR18_OESDE|nr:PDZ/DHR/GLGF domain protein [Oesophagostomum dentatum]
MGFVHIGSSELLYHRSRIDAVQVQIVKRDETLGATIRNDHGKIYIARLIAGGVAARSACIQEGDRILEVNGLPATDLSVDDVARILNRVDKGTVTLKLVPAEIAVKMENGTPHVYIRALFDYKGKEDDRHPCPEVALSFSRGDILELQTCNDDHWWQARRIGNGAFANCEDPKASSRVGLIPSEALQLSKSMSDIEQKQTDGRASGSRSGSSHETEYIYESVCRLAPREGLSRIIVLVGPPGVGRNELKRRLLARFPQRFSTTVPHTTRPKRAGEVEGVDYYFTERPVMEKMIYSGQMLEFGEFRGNLYGTALSSVRDAQQAGIPLITPHPLALQLLRTSEFMPFIVFIQPPDAATFKNTRVISTSLPRGQSNKSSTTRMFSDAEIEQIINGGTALYKQYGHIFDATIINKDLEESTAQLIRLIGDVETKPTWVPLSWATNLASE